MPPFFTRADKSRLKQQARFTCDACPYKGTAQLPPEGNEQSDFYVLMQSPNSQESLNKEYFQGKSGRYLKRYLPDDVRCGYCVNCYAGKIVKKEAIDCCLNSTIADIERVKPKVIITVGIIPTKLLLGKGKQLHLCTGKYFLTQIGNHTCYVYPIFDARFILENQKEKAYVKAFKRDLENVFNNPIPESECIDYEEKDWFKDVAIFLHNDYNSIIKELKHILEKEDVIAVDIEATYNRCYETDARILSIAISSSVRTIAIPLEFDTYGAIEYENDQLEEIYYYLYEIFISDKIIIAHNTTFELEWFLSYFDKEILYNSSWQDTLSASYILDCQKGQHSLDFNIRKYFGFWLKDISNIDTKKLEKYPITNVLKYNALDAKYTYKLYFKQMEELEEKGLLDVYDFHIERIPAIVQTQFKGISVDFNLADTYEKELSSKIEELKKEVYETKEAKLFKANFGRQLNSESSKQMTVLFRDLLKLKEGKRKSKTGYSVDAEVLTAVSGKVELAQVLLKLRGVSKLKSTYILNKENKNVKPDGKVHSTFNHTLTETGRLSSDKPNIQNFPKRKNKYLRGQLAAPKGWVFLSGDYGQIEARVVAMGSKDKAFCKALWDDYDIHMAWAERYVQIDKNVLKRNNNYMKKVRNVIKNGLVFPNFYGSSRYGIQKNLKLSDKNNKKLCDEFEETYKDIFAWQELLISNYYKKGYTECLNGRRRYGIMYKNEIINSPIQGTASEIVVDSMGVLSKKAYEEEKEYYVPILNIHDDLTFLVPEKYAEESMYDISRIMVTPRFDFINVPLNVEFSIGTNWDDMEEIFKFSSTEL